MADANTTLVREFYDAVWNAHNPQATTRYYADDYIDHDPAFPGQAEGAEGARQVFGTFLGAFPDLHFTVNLQIAEGDLVTSRWTSTGTNNGTLMGMPPTGRRITITGIDIVRVAAGKIVERWGSFDAAGLAHQLS